jgi:hypothetical protein
MTTIINGDSNINLDFSTGGRITGDFSNATIANRALFQTSTVNTSTNLGVIPNGTGTNGQINFFSSSDPANSSVLSILNNSVVSESRLQSGITGTGTYFPLTFFTGGSESLRLSPTSKAVILAGGSTSANGTGITFPATQSASSDANTLDDYEEGTFTPTDASGAGLTFGGITSARYTKIGNKVYIDMEVNYPSTASGAFASIGGLPFTSLSGDGNYSTGACMNDANLNVWPLISGGVTTITLYKQGAGPYGLVTNANFSGATPYISMAYTTA